MKPLKVLPHAIRRYRERTGASPKRTDAWVEGRLRNIVETGREWELKPDKRLRQLLMNDCQPARYFRKGDLLVVVADGLIKTCHTAAAGKWVPKYQLPNPTGSVNI